MAELATAFTSLFAGVGTAVQSVGTAIGSAGISGSTIASILSGTATLMSVTAAGRAAETDATALDLAAKDAEREKALETLQGINRRSSIRRAMADSIGSQTTAYAASGVDLTFGTPSQAREEAYRQADLGLETAGGTEASRLSRLDERAANLRIRAGETRRAARTTGRIAFMQGASDILRRG